MVNPSLSNKISSSEKKILAEEGKIIRNKTTAKVLKKVFVNTVKNFDIFSIIRLNRQ